MEIFQRIFESTPDSLLVVNHEGCITHANAEAGRMFGYAQHDFIGLAIEILIPRGLVENQLPAGLGYLAEPQARDGGSGRKLFGLHRDGSEFLVDVLLRPLDVGDETQLLCVARQVSERWRSDVFRGLFDAAPDPMVIVNERGQIVEVNARTELVFGYERAELIDCPVEMLIPERFRTERQRYFSDAEALAPGSGLELCGLRKDGTEFSVEISLSPLITERGVLVSSVIRDISDRKSAERVLDSLREKELLLKEVHHRVKNNLAVISSLFYLQSTYTHDERTTRILRESQDRVVSMALVHETLYRSDNCSSVNFATYVVGLCEHLIRSYGSRLRNIELVTDTEPVALGIDQAIPCGLILNELVTNALKHAFPSGEAGEVRVVLRRPSPDTCCFCVLDNGVGLPTGIAVETAATLGLRLVRSLTRQIDGTFAMHPQASGTEARLTLHVNV